ncbi:MAG: hypothetical protein AUG89_11575 [Acidobacteria bacterium 13_1_20CM_4_56_7]|nr:MAG: hypothetical protein AUG89_11575 [Acidobacteria bacterium 13_1_20CM_4_56_7]
MAYESGNPGAGMYDDATPSDKPAEKKDEATSSETALLPKSICPGMEPGQELVLKIDRVHDDQYEVSYAPEPKKEEPAKQPDEMSSMME